MIDKIFELIRNNENDRVEREMKEYTREYWEENINERDRSGFTLIYYAIIKNNIKMVEILINMGASIFMNVQKKPIFFYSIIHKYDDITEYIIRRCKEMQNDIITLLTIVDEKLENIIIYAIRYKNIKILRELLKISKDIFINCLDNRNIEGETILHIMSENTEDEITKNVNREEEKKEIINEILRYKERIDVTILNNNYESVLHIATKNNNKYIVERVIEEYEIKEIINMTDRENNNTPLINSYNRKNIEIFDILMRNGAKINVQDIKGRTILHNIIINNEKIFFNHIIINYNKYINYNLLDIYHNIPLYYAIKRNDEEYIKRILLNSNINEQNINKESCLYIICKKGIWMKYREILERKKLDINTPNRENEYCIDIIREDKREEFKEMVIRSYMNQLKYGIGRWRYKWQNYCSGDKKEEIKEEYKEIIGKEMRGEDEKICYEMIKKIVEGREEETYPKYKRYEINIEEIKNERRRISQIIGSTLDVLYGMIYCVERYKNVTCVIGEGFEKNKEYEEHKKKKEEYYEMKNNFTNFELIWYDERLFFPTYFDEKIKKKIENEKRYIIIPLVIELKGILHSNYLLYDKENKELERFEPHGSETNFKYDDKKMDREINEEFKRRIKEEIKYFSPSLYIPKISFQILESNEYNIYSSYIGMCMMWSLWYIKMRITHTNINRKKLIKYIIRLIRRSEYSFRNIIDNFAYEIIYNRNKFLKKIKFDIDKWEKINVSDELVRDVIGKIRKRIKELKI